jgi:carbamoyl-phosphate synthase large subunit
MADAVVLITGAGAPGIAGTIYALKENPERKTFRIISTDIDENAVGKYLTDVFYQVPSPENEDYLPSLEEIVKSENIDIIIPQTTREILVLAENVDHFRYLGAEVVVSPAVSIKTANDKYLLLEREKEINIPCPKYYLTDSETTLREAADLLGYPRKKAVVKPRISHGMRGLRILSEESWDVDRLLSSKPDGLEIGLDYLVQILSRGKWPQLIVSEYLPGEEYTIDVFRGSRCVVIPRKRLKIRSGISFDAEVDLREDLIEYSTRLAVALDLKYCFGFQFKMAGDGIPKLLECNPRVQGTMGASMMAGFNPIYYAVMEALGTPAAVDGIEIKNGTRFVRYWGGVGVSEGRVIGKI